ncbi:MAG TPA: cobalt ECF transporter T component CbiQ, partial [Bacillota bacterium]
MAAVGSFLGDVLGVGPNAGRRQGWLGRADPRAKVVGVLALLLAVASASHLPTLLTLHAGALALAASSRIGLGRYARRVWIGFPLITALIALPATLSWITPGDPVIWIWRGSAGVEGHAGRLAEGVAITAQGLRAATLLVLRSATAVAYALLLSWTTPWPNLYWGLRSVGVPSLMTAILAMTHRYLVVLAELLQDLYWARKARPG